MNRIEEKLIADVLNFAHLTSMPSKMTKKTALWIEAVAKVRKANATYAYAILRRTANLDHTFIYSNGATSPIVSVEEVYPIITLDTKYVKKFTDDSKDARIRYLRSMNLPYIETEKYFDGMTLEDLDKEVVKSAMYQQLEALKEE